MTTDTTATAPIDLDRLCYAIATVPFRASEEWGAWDSLWQRLASIHGEHGDGSRREAAAMLAHLIDLVLDKPDEVAVVHAEDDLVLGPPDAFGKRWWTAAEPETRA